MSKFSQFMKANKIEKKNACYAVTKSLCDKDGNPLNWEFQHITSKENETLRDECIIEVPITGKPHQYRQKLQSGKYIQKMIVASIVVPNLFDEELQDSYGVKKPEDLLMAMVDDPGEYNELAVFVQQFQGFDLSFEEKVNEAKN